MHRNGRGRVTTADAKIPRNKLSEPYKALRRPISKLYLLKTIIAADDSGEVSNWRLGADENLKMEAIEEE